MFTYKEFFNYLYENDAVHQKTLNDTGFWGKRGAGCIFLAADTKRICLPLRSRSVEQPNTWGVWGGALDGDEDPEEAVKREAQEETGHRGTVQLIPLHVFSKGTFKYYNFLAIVPHEFSPQLNWETANFVWTTFGKWPSPLHFGLESLIKNSGDKIQQAITTL